MLRKTTSNIAIFLIRTAARFRNMSRCGSLDLSKMSDIEVLCLQKKELTLGLLTEDVLIDAGRER